MTEQTKTKSAAALRRFVFLSQWRLSEMFAFSLIFALGALILIIHLLTWGAEARKDAKFLVETLCEVESAAIRPSRDAPLTQFRPEVTIRYELNGESFTTTTYDRLTLTDDKGFTYDRDGALEAIRPFYPGRRTTCWVRVDDPTKATLVKRSNVWGWVFLLIPTTLMLSGGALLNARIYERVFSQEARASARRQTTRYPTLPNTPPAGSSPGRELALRLAPDARSTFSFGTASFGAILWNVAVAAIFVWTLCVAKTRGDFVASWLFLAIFGGLGLVFACRVWTRLQIERVVGSTELEISTLPVLPGRKVKFCLFLRGRICVKRLDVFLKCEEIARYLQGTNSITHRHEAYSAPIFTQYGVDVPSRDTRLERFTATIPIGAAPSFRAEHNEVVWKVTLQMEFGDGGVYTRDFEIVVYPFLPKDER